VLVGRVWREGPAGVERVFGFQSVSDRVVHGKQGSHAAQVDVSVLAAAAAAAAAAATAAAAKVADRDARAAGAVVGDESEQAVLVLLQSAPVAVRV
jgi:hypothetical protein